MSSSTGWWARFPAAVDFGRAALANVIARVAGSRPIEDDGDAILHDVEDRLRVLLHDGFGVAPTRVVGHGSLAELGLDGLDVLDLVMRIEATLGIAFPEGEVDAVRTFDDLAMVTRALLSVRAAVERPPAGVAQVRIRLAEDRHGGPALERVVAVTPYDCELVADDVGRAGVAERCDVVVSADDPVATAALDRMLVRSRLDGARPTVRRLAPVERRDPDARPEAAMRTPATNVAALRIARHAVMLLDALSDERGATVVRLAARRGVGDATMDATRAATNRRVGALRTVVRTYGPVLGRALRARVDAALDRLGDLAAVRVLVDDLAIDAPDTLEAFRGIARSLTAYVWTLEVVLPDRSLVPQQMCLSALVAATEAGGVEHAVIGGALAREDVLSPADRADVAALVALQRTQLALATRIATDEIAVGLGRCADDPSFRSVADYEHRLLEEAESRPVAPRAWFDAMGAKLGRLRDLEARQLESLMQRALGTRTSLAS